MQADRPAGRQICRQVDGEEGCRCLSVRRGGIDTEILLHPSDQLQRERERETRTHTHRKREREIDRETQKETHTHTEREREKANHK